jgi:hypothetical protein
LPQGILTRLTENLFQEKYQKKMMPYGPKKKCFLALENTHCDLVIASKGSFGAHPSLLFTNNDEISLPTYTK